MLLRDLYATKIVEGFSPDDISVGGTVIYIDRSAKVYRLTKCRSKSNGNNIRLQDGSTVDTGDIVSTDSSDWSHFKNRSTTLPKR